MKKTICLVVGILIVVGLAWVLRPGQASAISQSCGSTCPVIHWTWQTQDCPTADSAYTSNNSHKACSREFGSGHSKYTKYADKITTAHNVDVAYKKSGDQNKCHRPSDNDLEDDYGMDHDTRSDFKNHNPETLDSIPKSCPVNGGWSDWNPSSCPTEPGSPASTQTRACTNPAPANGGAACVGESSKICAAVPPATGTIKITKYECPADTTVTRSTNGPSETDINNSSYTVPTGCTLQKDAKFGYTYDVNNNTNNTGPYLGLFGDPTPFTPFTLTDINGVTTLNNAATPGRYIIAELDSGGKQLPAGDMLSLYCYGDGDTTTTNDNQEITFSAAGKVSNCVAYNKKAANEQRAATVVVSKIVCNSETDLPNWGAGSSDITADTASDFVTNSEGKCHLQSGWDFQWAPDGTANPGDNNTEAAGSPWTTFGSTDVNGIASTQVPSGALVWVREVLKPDYIPFSGWLKSEQNQTPSTQDAVSAEMYCNTDVLNYDNYDWINPVNSGETYQCVAFNAPTAQACTATDVGNDVVSDTSNQVNSHGAVVVTPNPAWTTISGVNWIWDAAQVADPTVDQTDVFTKTFTVSGAVISAGIDIAADNGYTLKVNGHLVDDKITVEHNYETTTNYDVASLLHGGTNTLEITVKNFALLGSTPETNPAGLLYKLTVRENDCLPPPLTCDEGFHPVGDSCVQNDTTPPGPTYLKVHIYKYLQSGETIAQVPDESAFAPFPMVATWSAANTAGTGSYVLGNNHGGAALRYSADTSPMLAPANYTTSEVTDSSSNVLPIGAQCAAGKFQLVGYKDGDSLGAAESAQPSDTAPVYTVITTDKYEIVVNKQCSTEVVCNDDQQLNNEGVCVPKENNSSDNNSDEGEGNDDQGPGLTASVTTGGGGGGGSFSGSRHDISALLAGNNGGGEVLGASTEGSLACEPYLNDYIKMGANNNTEEVKKLQAFLNQFFEVNNPVTGVYGPITQDMVNKFQAHEEVAVLTPWAIVGLPTNGPTGYVYKTTKRWINILKCPEMIANSPIPPLP